MKPSRQSSIPRSKDTRGLGETGLPQLHLGWVTAVYPKVGKQAGTVDVMLDDMTMLRNVGVGQDQTGPDREVVDLPRKRSRVGIMYAWGGRLTPLLVAVFPRADTGPAGDSEAGLYRRVFPNGMHVAVRDEGTLEVRFPDGSSLVMGTADTPHWDFTGQDKEGEQGDPFLPAEPIKHPKPDPYGLMLAMADGSRMQFKDGKWLVTLAKDASITAAGDLNIKAANVTVEASGSAKLKGMNVSVEASLTCDVKGLLVKLNGGSMPIARVGDAVAFAGPILGPGNLGVLA
jgi:hypothetical protein